MNAITPIKAARPITRDVRRSPAHLPHPAFENLQHIPGKRGLPIFGALPEAAWDPLRFARRMNDRFGPVHRFYALGCWNVQLIGPEASELILFDADKIFSAHHGWKPVLGPLFQGGLLLRDLEDHRVHRRAIGSAFKPDKVEAYLSLFDARARATIDSWSGRRFHFYPAIREMALDVAAISFLGLTLDDEAIGFSKAFKALVEGTVSVLPGAVPGSRLSRGLAGRRFLDRFIRERIVSRREGDGSDLFSQLCQARYDDGELLQDQEIVDHLIFVLAAAHDTLTSALSSTVYYLGRHPEWQQRARDELRESSAARRLDPEALSSLPVTDCVIKEALRLNTPAPIIWRRALVDFEFGGYSIPAGTPTAANVLLTHRLPEVWPNPEQFDPSRFEAEQSADRHRFAWTPFGGGAHMCLGLHHAMTQAKAFLLRLLVDHEIVLDEHYQPRWYWWPNCRPLDGLPVSVRRLDDRTAVQGPKAVHVWRDAQCAGSVCR